MKLRNKNKGDGSYDPNSSKNYSYLKSKKDVDTYRYRNVYESQDLKRGEIGKVQSKTRRMVLLVFLAILFFSIFLSAFTGVRFLKYTFTGKAMERDLVVSGITDSDNERIRELRFKESDREYIVEKDGDKYYSLDENGNRVGDAKDSLSEAVPEWYLNLRSTYMSELKKNGYDPDRGFFSHISFISVILSIVFTAPIISALYFKLMKNLRAQNIMNETEDINQYEDDQHIALPEEVISNDTYDFFPDAGAHAPINVSTLISHIAMANKGVKSIKVATKATEDIFDEDGDIFYYKGEVMYDDDDEVIYNNEPMFDSKFAHSLFDASKLPNDKALRKFFNPSKMSYNEGNQVRERMEGYNTVADMINDTWVFPDYENQRPGGCYIVDTAPVNTMCLAIN